MQGYVITTFYGFLKLFFGRSFSMVMQPNLPGDGGQESGQDYDHASGLTDLSHAVKGRCAFLFL